jgi:hypothetical protein
MLQYLIFLLLIFIIMIYAYIYINYKTEKNRAKLNKSKQATKTTPIILQKSFDQIHNGFKYPSINYKWGGCSENKPTTKAIKPGSWFEYRPTTKVIKSKVICL